WSGVHLSSAARPLRARCIARLGEQAYKGVFTLALVTAIVLMVVGWRSAPPASVYAPPAWGHSAALPLVFLALVLFAASTLESNVKRFVRHPQLSGVCVWAGAHLLSNGDSRSLVLFGVLGAWALVEMGLISRREGPWERPGPQPLVAELKPLVGALVIYLVLFVAHPYLFGASPMP
ncbi:MAG: NnrU family protein, partial [Myxococcota bacterium]